jgi:hypothetical protein
VQRCFYSAVALKSVAVARAFSTAYVCGPVCWNVRFSAMCGRTGGTCTLRQLTCQKFRTPGSQPIFYAPRVRPISIFWIRRIVHFSGTHTGNLRPLQQFGIFFVDCEIGFVRIADFFCISYAFLKELCLYGFDLTYPPLPILHYLSSRTYPPEPILQNLSYSTYPPVRIVWENRSVLRSALKCGWGDRLYGNESIFNFCPQIYFLGNCFL